MFNNSKKILFLIILVFVSSCWSASLDKDWLKLKGKDSSLELSREGLSVDSKEGDFELNKKWAKLNLWENSWEITRDWINVDVKNLEKLKTNLLGDGAKLDIWESDSSTKNNNPKWSKWIISCENNYNDLFSKYRKNYSHCYFNKPDISSCEWKNSKKPKINLVVVFDASWSMWAKIWDESMMDIAKDSVSNYVSNIGSDTNLSFVIYGHKWSHTQSWKKASCDWVEEIYSFSQNNVSKLGVDISKLKPNWWTPIDKSLSYAHDLIQKQKKQDDKNIILLVSDWKETCGWNPVSKALDISKTKNTFIDVIWFNVKGDTQKQLRDIAKSWRGNYYDVESRIEFEQTFSKTKNFLNTMSCGATKTAVELSYWIDAINKYYTCMYELKEEQIFMMADADSSCKKYFQSKLEKRYNLYENKFEKILDKWKDILDDFWELIEEIEEKFED